MILICQEAFVPRQRLVLNAAAVMATLLVLGAVATAAEIEARSSNVLELQPGMTKIVKPDRPVQAIVIGNPNIADASAINLGAIAVTGKGAGLTNFILFDEEGKEISNTRIQVVGADAYKGGDNVRERREINVLSMWGGASAPSEPTDRKYLCAQNCSAIQIELSPPSNSSGGGAAISKTITTSPSRAPQTPHAPAPEGRY
jgi:hypothetical protein